MRFTIKASQVSTMTEHKLDNTTRYLMKVNVEELKKAFDLENWTQVNPRKQNLNSKPAKEMYNALTEDSRDIFHILNKGITISAKSCNYLSIPGNPEKSEVIITLENEEVHGVLDGGHTLKTIIKALKNEEIMGVKHVMLEVFTNTESILSELARARNTSLQVKEKSIANMEGKFDFLKKGLSDTPFYHNISWVENEPGEITVTQIIQLLSVFDRKAEASKAKVGVSSTMAVEKRFLSEYLKGEENGQIENVFWQMMPLYKDIFYFVDYLNVEIPKAYNEVGKEGKGGKFGLIDGVKTNEKKPFPLKYWNNSETTKYLVPLGFLLPVFGAFRFAYEINPNTHKAEWKYSPIELFEETRLDIIKCVIDTHNSVKNVSLTGKNLALWENLGRIMKHTIEIKDLKKQLNNA